MKEEYKNFCVTIEYTAKVTAWMDIVASSEEEAIKLAKTWDATDYCLQKTDPCADFEIVNIENEGSI